MKTDGRCANCGRVPVDESTLCADCLAACEIEREHNRSKSTTAIINRLVTCEITLKEKEEELIKLKIQLRLQRRLLRHIFEEYQSVIKIGGG